jgi:hypothetical protein
LRLLPDVWPFFLLSKSPDEVARWFAMRIPTIAKLALDLNLSVKRHPELPPWLEWAPRGGQGSSCWFDRLPGILELLRAEITDGRV